MCRRSEHRKNPQQRCREAVRAERLNYNNTSAISPTNFLRLQDFCDKFVCVTRNEIKSRAVGMAAVAQSEQRIGEFHRVLSKTWGPQHWWPAQSRFEVIAGAYLTQNTAWTNVERAFENLRRANLLSLNGIRDISIDELESLIRPAGYFRQKARRLKTFIEYLDTNYGGSLDLMFAQPTQKLRDELLALNGIGPETADSILLYAGNQPVFVVDAYTRRILNRHAILPLTARYEEIRTLFERALARIETAPVANALEKAKSGEANGAAYNPSRMSLSRRTALVQIFNEMHALIVGVGKNYCSNRKPDCDHCPLRRFLPPPRRAE
jgi:endonuclease III related protein